MRPDWDTYFLRIAQVLGKRNTCDRAHVGCVLAVEKRILSAGYNGSPTRQEQCDDIGHLRVDGHCVRSIHAETNAIIQAALHGVSTKGATSYVTHYPCINCAKALVNAGITRLYETAYNIDPIARSFFQAADVEEVQVQVLASES